MLQPILCFLIDDDIDDQEVFELALQDLNLSVKCLFANSAIDALNQFQDKAFVPDFIFLDLNMPRVNGKQCLVEIKKINHLANIPIVVYSTSSDQKRAIECKELGAEDYWVKPASITTLTQMLANLFKRHRPVSTLQT